MAFPIPSMPGRLDQVELYTSNGRSSAVFAVYVNGQGRRVFCASLPDCEFTGNQLRKFYKYALDTYGLTKQDFYGKYDNPKDDSYPAYRFISGRDVCKYLYLVGSSAYIDALFDDWQSRCKRGAK